MRGCALRRKTLLLQLSCFDLASSSDFTFMDGWMNGWVNTFFNTNSVCTHYIKLLNMATLIYSIHFPWLFDLKYKRTLKEGLDGEHKPLDIAGSVHICVHICVCSLWP